MRACVCVMIIIIIIIYIYIFMYTCILAYPMQPPNANYPTVLSVPTGCPRDQCYFYVEMLVSDEDKEFLDFQMEGKATGYIAIGFGTQRKWMVSDRIILISSNIVNSELLIIFDQFDADVFACAVNPTTGMVEAFDTYNTAGETWNNIRDTDVNQASVHTHAHAHAHTHTHTRSQPHMLQKLHTKR